MVSSHQTRDLECFADSSSIQWSLPRPLLQSLWDPSTHVTVLAIDLYSGFRSLLQVFFALGCRCVAVCVEHNERSLRRLPKQPSRNQCTWSSLTSWTQRRSSECSRADPLIWFSSGEVRRVQATLSGAQM